MPDVAIWPFEDIPLIALVSAGAALAALVSFLQELARRGGHRRRWKAVEGQWKRN